MNNSEIVRLAVCGGKRGKAFNNVLELLKDKVQLVSICDRDSECLTRWKEQFPDINTYDSYDSLIDADDFDAVFIATPIEYHFEQSIMALRAGKHVLCEVYAANTIDELWELVETVEKSQLVYMMAENYCYMRQNAMIQTMIQQDVFGEITYAEGGYIHDCRNIRLDSKGKITWRGEQMRTFRGNSYPTHSLGPIAKWLGINEKDRLLRTSTFVSKHASINRYIQKKFGNEHEALKRGYWKNGDSVITALETASGALIILRFDGESVRPHNMVHYELQGTKASYLSQRHGAEEPLVWIEGYSKEDENGLASEWDTLWKHSYKYEHPLWAKHMKDAVGFGHGGGDFFVLQEFINSIITRRKPFIDVYDAAVWSSIVPLSADSVKSGNIVVNIPDFKSK